MAEPLAPRAVQDRDARVGRREPSTMAPVPSGLASSTTRTDAAGTAVEEGRDGPRDALGLVVGRDHDERAQLGHPGHFRRPRLAPWTPGVARARPRADRARVVAVDQRRARRARSRRGDLPSFTTLVTTDQTAGRGRLGRTWVAPAGSALAVSVLVVPRTASGPLALDRFGWLPIAAGVAMTETVADVLPEASTGFKWPNDVLVNGRKVCGVLAELLPERGGVVIGAGVNLGDDRRAAARRRPRPRSPIEGADGFDRRHRAGRLPRRACAHWSRRTSRPTATPRRAGSPALARSLCITLGREVRVELPDGGRARGHRDGPGCAMAGWSCGSPTARDETVAAGDVTHARMVPPGPAGVSMSGTGEVVPEAVVARLRPHARALFWPSARAAS